MENKINLPKLGMQLTKHQSQLSNLEYSVALNANIAAVDGSIITLTNEPSNLLCSRFKPGYRVIGTLPINVENKVIFFLINPYSNQSEIGMINNVSFTDNPDLEIYCASCNKPLQEQTPLELQTPTELCTYTTILDNQCLNFSLDFPVTGIWRKTKDGITIFFSSRNNPMRYVELFDLDNFDCNLSKIVPDYSLPCISTVDVVSGGSLKEGVYQFTATYSEIIKQNDSSDNVPITDYFPITNPTPIFQEEVKVDTDSPTDKAIKIKLSNVDLGYNYVNIIVIITINNLSTPYLVATLPVTSSELTYTYTGNNQRIEIPITFDEIQRKRPVYTSARAVTEANDILFWYDLKEQRPINLQPVVSNIPLQWQTIEAPEDFYSNPVNNNFVSFPRDEVVPFGIQFIFSNGFGTAIFPFVASEAPSSVTTLTPSSDPNYIPTDNSCNTTERKYKWQFYNTASVSGDSPCYRPFSIFDKYKTSCDTNPFQFGDFAYWESSLNYPDNVEVWGELANKPIRHFKFPDNCVSPILDNPNSTEFGVQNKIYPIGVRLDVETVKNYLSIAVAQNLITEEEKLNITSYRIFRGDINSNKSIVAKGILTNIAEVNAFTVNANNEPEPIPNKSIFYPNYGFNDLHLNINNDGYIMGYKGLAPFSTGRYTFHSPETNFNQPLLPTEIKTELIIGGKAVSQFSEVEKHSKYVLLNDGAYALANSLAGIEVIADIIIAASGSTLLDFAALVGIATSTLNNTIDYATDWLRILKSLGNPYNPTIFNVAKGNYTNSCCPNLIQTFQQKIDNSFYLPSTNISTLEDGQEIRINNINREKSVYLKLPEAFKMSIGCNIPDDDSKERFGKDDLVPYDSLYNCTKDVYREPRNIKTLYTSLKNYIPDQWGTIDQIQWIDTGYCGNIQWDTVQDSLCDTIFGGNTYIGRHYELKKFPFFVQDRVGSNTDDDVQYQLLSNVGACRFYFNSIDQPSWIDGISPLNVLTDIFDPINAELECDSASGSVYHKGFLNLYNYSVSSFIVESSYNVNFRHAENDIDKNFYPNIQDLSYWRQQYRNPIQNPNYYFYNTTYSKNNTENPWYILKDNFSQVEEDRRSFHPNRTIFSKVEDWLSYSALDFYDFPQNDGRLIGIKGIEQQSVLVTQENATKIFNAYITVNTSLAQAQITTGNLFNQKPKQYYKTDLGFAGATQQQIVSTPYGHFYVNTQNPAILQQQGDSLKDITEDTENKKVKQWFVNNLPFSISKDFPEIKDYLIDNVFKNIGVTLGWDNKFKRIFITKKDYSLKPEFKNVITFKDNEFYLDDVPVSLNSEYFINKSWTIAYSPIYQQFVSFYSFFPNYYTSQESYFSTGYEDAIYNHLLTEQSYQVFQGNLHPFIVDYSTENKLNNNILQSVRYLSDFRRFQGEQNWAVNNKITFNKALLYNQNQSSGMLNLIPQEPNNQRQIISYPKQNLDSRDILVKNVENYWTFNQFNDISLNNNNPILIYNNPYIKELNPDAISYKPTFYKNLLRNNYFNLRLINDKYSKYNILLHNSVTQQQNSPI